MIIIDLYALERCFGGLFRVFGTSDSFLFVSYTLIHSSGKFERFPIIGEICSPRFFGMSLRKQ